MAAEVRKKLEGAAEEEGLEGRAGVGDPPVGGEVLETDEGGPLHAAVHTPEPACSTVSLRSCSATLAAWLAHASSRRSYVRPPVFAGVCPQLPAAGPPRALSAAAAADEAHAAAQQQQQLLQRDLLLSPTCSKRGCQLQALLALTLRVFVAACVSCNRLFGKGTNDSVSTQHNRNLRPLQPAAAPPPAAAAAVSPPRWHRTTQVNCELRDLRQQQQQLEEEEEVVLSRASSSAQLLLRDSDSFMDIDTTVG
ncbi:hypothetical protein Esti_002986 [Eimeria stiedai]